MNKRDGIGVRRRGACWGQPFYHLLAETPEGPQSAYLPEASLEADDSGEPVLHPSAAAIFERRADGGYAPRRSLVN